MSIYSHQNIDILSVADGLIACRWLHRNGGVGDLREDDVEQAILDWQSSHDSLAPHGLGIACECECCGCDEPAEISDHGVRLCRACGAYTVDENGDVICSRDERTEVVVESCGAGGQTHSYVRLSAPDEPPSDADGEYACYWWTVLDDAHVVSRHATYEDAHQACEARDWPAPGDHTAYRCGYEVRRLQDGEWV